MKRFLLSSLLVLSFLGLQAQSGIYIPSAKPIKDIQKAMQNPEQFCLLLNFLDADSTLSLSNLDLLDSVYRLAFDQYNPKLYTMLIEGYGSDDSLTQRRVDAVYHYFAHRCHSPFPVRYAVNPIHCSCHGDTIERLRFEVPVSKSVFNQGELPEARLLLNKTISVRNSVLVTFRNNPDECIGLARGCYIPRQDSTIRGYYVSMDLKRGSVYAVDNTKDSCPPPLRIDIEEHLDYHALVERYFLIPHRKHLLVNAGYIVLNSNFRRTAEECSLPLLDSIYVRIPITQEQWDNKLRIFAKKYSEKGVEYKNLTTKKIKVKGTDNLYAQVAINPAQFDTLFLGKRVQPEEIDDYFYEVESNREVGSFKFGEDYYKAYSVDKHGDYELKKPFRALFRIIEEEEEEEPQLELPKSEEDIPE